MEKLTPIQRYREAVNQGKIIADPAQEHGVLMTQKLYELILRKPLKQQTILNWLRVKFFRSSMSSVKGIYFWGSVGSGKTYVVDSFFESLPIEAKTRIHFHRFMEWVHDELKIIKDSENPLQSIASDFAKHTKLICFDEFYVSDITDAMLLSGLLKAMFERDIILVASSNEHPDQLYYDGLQRSRFIPAIDLIKEHTQIVQMDSGIDYRLRYLDTAQIYHFPLNEDADELLATNFKNLSPNTGRANQSIEIKKREIQTVYCADGVVWFDFSLICNSPRGVADYIEIARQFQTVLIANVPQMHDDIKDQAQRFITLVDEFYDRNVILVITAAVKIDELYLGERLVPQFKRTKSRLYEMQSHDYLARKHLTE